MAAAIRPDVKDSPMRTLAALVLLGLAGAGSAHAAAASASTQIIQQRTADGRILLTDRPAAGATTERSWQLQAEDPAAARQRALDVKAEANIVAERVARRIEQQQRRADDDYRMRVASLSGERSVADDDEVTGGGLYLFAPNRYRYGAQQHRMHRGDGHGRGPGRPGTPRFSGSGSLGSR